VNARIDHLVVLAPTLDEGVAWCEATLGVTPGPGGRHPLMGTHNRLLRIATVDFPRAYFELIAVEPQVRPEREGPRWFDLDDEQVRDTLRRQGPRLAHFVANVSDVRSAAAALAALDIDRGEVLRASRETPRGLLEWQITVRTDGRRLFDGCLPTLIQWGDVHPAAGMADSGVVLQSLTVTHPEGARLKSAFDAVGLERVTALVGPPNLCAQLVTPRGGVRLESKGL
jgi:hypothetical protein